MAIDLAYGGATPPYGMLRLLLGMFRLIFLYALELTRMHSCSFRSDNAHLDPTDFPSLAHGVDPQLVDAPSAIGDHGDGDSEDSLPSASSSDNAARSKDSAKE